jgi:hypothetical protein
VPLSAGRALPPVLLLLVLLLALAM